MEEVKKRSAARGPIDPALPVKAIDRRVTPLVAITWLPGRRYRLEHCSKAIFRLAGALEWHGWATTPTTGRHECTAGMRDGR